MNATRVCRCGHIRNLHHFLLGGCSGTGNDRLSSWSCGCAKFLDTRATERQRARLPVPNQPGPMVVDAKTTEIIGRLWSILQMEKCGVQLPTDGAKITVGMLDSKSDLQDLIEDSERFRG